MSLALALMVALHVAAGRAQIAAYERDDRATWRGCVAARELTSATILDLAGETGREWLRAGA